MKFISKNSNLRIVLRPGLQASPLAGRDAVPGIYVKFQDGVAIVNDEEHVAMMLKHPGFNVDFISPDEDKDPYAHRRSEIEPGHVIQEMRYGHVEGVKSSAKKVPLSPEMAKLINDLAEKRVKEILPSAIEIAIKAMAKVSKEDSVEIKEEKTTSRSDDFEKGIYQKVQPQPVEANEMFSGASVDDSNEEESSEEEGEPVVEQKPRRGRPSTKK